MSDELDLSSIFSCLKVISERLDKTAVPIASSSLPHVVPLLKLFAPTFKPSEVLVTFRKVFGDPSDITPARVLSGEYGSFMIVQVLEALDEVKIESEDVNELKDWVSAWERAFAGQLALFCGTKPGERQGEDQEVRNDEQARLLTPPLNLHDDYGGGENDEAEDDLYGIGQMGIVKFSACYPAWTCVIVEEEPDDHEATVHGERSEATPLLCARVPTREDLKYCSRTDFTPLTNEMIGQYNTLDKLKSLRPRINLTDRKLYLKGIHLAQDPQALQKWLSKPTAHEVLAKREREEKEVGKHRRLTLKIGASTVVCESESKAEEETRRKRRK